MESVSWKEGNASAEAAGLSGMTAAPAVSGGAEAGLFRQIEKIAYLITLLTRCAAAMIANPIKRGYAVAYAVSFE